MGSAKRNIYGTAHFEHDNTSIVDFTFRDHQTSLSIDSTSPTITGSAAQGLIDARGTEQGFDDAWDDCDTVAQTWWANRDATAKSDIRTWLTRFADCFN